MRVVNPFAASSGSLIGAYAERMADSLARRRAEQEARAAREQGELLFRSRSQFLANMNHELRTPLNAIIGFATMLKDTESYDLDPGQRRAYADYVLQSADLLLSHINTILEIAALESGSLEMERTTIDLGELVRNAVERVRITAEAAGVRIVDKTADAPVYALIDAERVAQALDHVLRTAIGASTAGGKVLIRTNFDDNGGPEIAVRDAGEGLSAQEAEDALNAFESIQLDLDQSLAKPGAGLAISRKFLEMQGGALFLKSRKGRGTLARLTLPAGQDIQIAGPVDAIDAHPHGGPDGLGQR
ncbi:MAG: sensor histidine kinase [Parvularculaceae bacterium]